MLAFKVDVSMPYHCCQHVSEGQGFTLKVNGLCLTASNLQHLLTNQSATSACHRVAHWSSGLRWAASNN